MQPDRLFQARLSTGTTVELPLELSFAMGGVVVPARHSRLDEALPDALSPMSIAPRVGCVALVGIHYHWIGGADTTSTGGTEDTGIEPYDEFAAIVPAVRGSQTNLALAQLVDGEIGGYVHWLPVTTDEGVALGRELWGYPKERTEITVTDGPRGVRAVVGDDRSATVRLEVTRPRGSRRRDWQLRSYTTLDDEFVRTRADVRGPIAIGSPIGAHVSVESELKRMLGLWEQPLSRLYGSRIWARLHPGESTTDNPGESTTDAYAGGAAR